MSIWNPRPRGVCATLKPYNRPESTRIVTPWWSQQFPVHQSSNYRHGKYSGEYGSFIDLAGRLSSGLISCEMTYWVSLVSLSLNVDMIIAFLSPQTIRVRRLLSQSFWKCGRLLRYLRWVGMHFMKLSRYTCDTGDQEITDAPSIRRPESYYLNYDNSHAKWIYQYKTTILLSCSRPMY